MAYLRRGHRKLKSSKTPALYLVLARVGGVEPVEGVVEVEANLAEAGAAGDRREVAGGGRLREKDGVSWTAWRRRGGDDVVATARRRRRGDGEVTVAATRRRAVVYKRRTPYDKPLQ